MPREHCYSKTKVEETHQAFSDYDTRSRGREKTGKTELKPFDRLLAFEVVY